MYRKGINMEYVCVKRGWKEVCGEGLKRVCGSKISRRVMYEMELMKGVKTRKDSREI